MSLVTHHDGPYMREHGKRVYLAKLITNAAEDETVVYLNSDPMDNRRETLRVVKSDTITACAPPGAWARRRLR